MDITDADSLEIKVISYVDNTTSRTYHITFAHDFSVKTADAQHLKTAATCSKPAEYYFSCACGEVDKSENAKTFLPVPPPLTDLETASALSAVQPILWQP